MDAHTAMVPRETANALIHLTAATDPTNGVFTRDDAEYDKNSSITVTNPQNNKRVRINQEDDEMGDSEQDNKMGPIQEEDRMGEDGDSDDYDDDDEDSLWLAIGGGGDEDNENKMLAGITGKGAPCKLCLALRKKCNRNHKRYDYVDYVRDNDRPFDDDDDDDVNNQDLLGISDHDSFMKYLDQVGNEAKEELTSSPFYKK